MTLLVSEIFHSIQGESTWAGLPCTFVRLAGCNLDCTYCDTRYARSGGEPMSLHQILERVNEWPGDLVEITGGEPLLQKECHDLCKALADQGKTVLLETNGSRDISVVDARVIRIMDIKTPGSGMADATRWENLDFLRPKDEIKFVLTSRDDFEWACDLVQSRSLTDKGQVLFSAAQPHISPSVLAAWILESGLQVRLQLQLHKVLWPNRDRGV